MRILVAANGIYDPMIDLISWRKKTELLIAADGGSEQCLRAGVVPDVVIGDLDSISADSLRHLKKVGKKILSYPVEKDFTDLELALRYAVDHGGTEIVVLGALGARWDMSIANLMLLGADFLKNVKVCLVAENQETFLIREGREAEIQGAPGDLVSLIPMGGDVHGVTTAGLRYPLNDETLIFAATRGVSNQLISYRGGIRLKVGALLCIHHRVPADEG